jgi:ketosteroid isomerase-like protein
MGGTPEGNTLARNDGWEKIIKFLDRSLHAGQKNPAAKDKNSGSRIKQDLIALEHKWNAAFRRKDIKALDSLMANDIIITYGNGKMANKKQELASFETGIESSSLDDFKVKLHGDVAVVMFRLTAKGPKFDMTNNQFRYTDVFVKRDGRWQCVVSHNTRVEK